MKSNPSKPLPQLPDLNEAAARFNDFNGELGKRLDALDRREHVDPAYVRARLLRINEAMER